MNQDLIAVGEIVAPRGIRGEVKVILYAGDPHRLDTVTDVFLTPPGSGGSGRPAVIERTRLINGKPVVKFKNIDSMNDALLIKGFFLEVPESAGISLAADEYFWHDLLGSRVYDLQGTDYGDVVDIIETGSNDVLVARRGDREYLIPLLKSVIRSVDSDLRKIVIDPLPGLFSDDED